MCPTLWGGESWISEIGKEVYVLFLLVLAVREKVDEEGLDYRE
jgi:hypothetical protein